MMNLKYDMKKKLSVILVVALMVATIGSAQATDTQAGEIHAQELSVGNGTGDKEDISSLLDEETQEVTARAETEKTSGEAQEITLEEETTEQTTEETTEETTEAPTTQQPTTEQATTKFVLKPWGKNEKGEFVNGNKKVIKGATMKGVDVSYHNGVINWSKVAKSDVDYAIIRCGYGDNIASQDDKRWAENVAGCEKNGIPYGVYIYSYAVTTAQAKSEAKHVLRLVKGHTLNFPIYYDMEDAVQAKLTTKQREKIAKKFLSVIGNAGYECGIYSNLNWWTNYLSEALSNNLTWYKWVAQYNNNACTYDGIYQMWQCTSTGSVSGISGNVDLNFWYGEVRTTKYNILNSNKVSAPKPVTVPKRVTLKTLKKGKKKATLKWKKVTGAKGYKIEYSQYKSFASWSIKSKFTAKTSITVKKLTSKRTYYFRVKAYKKNALKQKIYSNKWSKIKHTKIK